MSQADVELVRHRYAALPDLRDADPRDDRILLDGAFRDYLDERYRASPSTGPSRG